LTSLVGLLAAAPVDALEGQAEAMENWAREKRGEGERAWGVREMLERREREEGGGNE
jgi:hypothetical protein